MPVKHTLSSFQINFGDPASPDGAIYDERTLTKTKSGDDVETLTWNLSGMKDPFMVCGYTGTNIILTRKVSGLSKCQAVSVKKKGMGKFEMQSTSCS